MTDCDIPESGGVSWLASCITATTAANAIISNRKKPDNTFPFTPSDCPCFFIYCKVKCICLIINDSALSSAAFAAIKLVFAFNQDE